MLTHCVSGGLDVRTTLTIDDDVLEAARELASLERRSIGEVVSDLVRRALRPSAAPAATRNGILLLPNREGAPPVTMELVNRLRDDEA
jgi:hypothetical protein